MSHFKDSFIHSSARFVESSSQKVDPLVENQHSSVVDSVFPDVRRFSPQGTAALATTVVYQLPNSGYVHEIAIKNDFAQTTTQDVIAYPGMACISRVLLRAGSNVLMDFDYIPAVQYMMRVIGNHTTISKLLDASGGSSVDTTSASVPNLMALIPTFFSGLMGNKPLILHKIKDTVELEITYRTAAQITISGGSGAAISNSQMVVFLSDAGDNLRSSHGQEMIIQKSLDLRTFKSAAVTTGTETTLDISGVTNGLVKHLLVTCTESSDIATSAGVDYFENKPLDTLKTQIDGREETIWDDVHESELSQVIYNQGKPQSSTLGFNNIVPLTQHTIDCKMGQRNNIGGLHSAKVNKFNLKVTHSVGANAEIGVCAVSAALYQYSNGSLLKIN